MKYPILNGALECSLREYVLFSGKYNDFRAEGGSVHNDTFRRNERPKVHRMSDSEWEKETRPYGSKGSKGGKKDGRKDGRKDGKKPFRKNDRDSFKDRRHQDSRREDRNRAPRLDFDNDESRFIPRERPDAKAPAKKVSDRGPRLGADATTFRSPAKMRSKRIWKKPDADDAED